MYYEKKSTPRVIWKQDIGDVTLSAIEQGYHFGKCGLRMVRRRGNKILQNYATYVPVAKLESLLDGLDGDIEPKKVLLSLRDEIPAQTCKQAGFGRGSDDLCKTFLVTSTADGKALLQSTVQWGARTPRELKVEIPLDNLYNMCSAMESGYRAYQLCKTASNAGRLKRNKVRGLDICAV